MGPTVNPRYQTLAEIAQEYPDQWVLIDRPSTDRYGDVTGGVVTVHLHARDEFDRTVAESHLDDSAVLFTGYLNPESI
jgi:hypothetical protein